MSIAAHSLAQFAFSHVDTWVFDLDNTLYPPDSALWPQIDERITAYLMQLYGLDGLSARALQKHFYHRHGTTLKALIDQGHADPDHFMDFVHDIDRSSLTINHALSEALGRLPGRKLILTNGSCKHAEKTAGALGILGHFEGIFDIKAAARRRSGKSRDVRGSGEEPRSAPQRRHEDGADRRQGRGGGHARRMGAQTGDAAFHRLCHRRYRRLPEWALLTGDLASKQGGSMQALVRSRTACVSRCFDDSINP
jgi:pyrimidine 5'-nucleotidase